MRVPAEGVSSAAVAPPMSIWLASCAEHALLFTWFMAALYVDFLLVQNNNHRTYRAVDPYCTGDAVSEIEKQNVMETVHLNVSRRPSILQVWDWPAQVLFSIHHLLVPSWDKHADAFYLYDRCFAPTHYSTNCLLPMPWRIVGALGTSNSRCMFGFCQLLWPAKS